MLHVYYGTDRQRVRDAAAGFVEQNLPPDGTVTTLDAAEYAVGQLSDALGATSLFGGVEWFMVDSPADSADLQSEVADSLDALSQSTNMFIVLEGKLLAPQKKEYEKHATVLQEFTIATEQRFNTFALADALAARDRRQLWMLLQEAKQQGSSPEELIGILWWQIKSLLLVQKTTSATEAGMKDYPYNKAKRALSKFAPQEVEQLACTLLSVYHDGHAGVRDLDIALEVWMLTGK